MKKIIIIGAGGHGAVVADILGGSEDRFELLGFLDDNPDLLGKKVHGLPVLGKIDQISTFDHNAIIIAIGDNTTRRNLFEQLEINGEHMASAVHRSAIIASDVGIAAGSVVNAGVVINAGCKIGRNVILNTSCSVDHHSEIHDHCHIAPGVHTGGNVKVGEGTFIGIGAIIAPQCRIGNWSIIGAGSVVNKDLPDSVLVAGRPARLIRNY